MPRPGLGHPACFDALEVAGPKVRLGLDPELGAAGPLAHGLRCAPPRPDVARRAATSA
ncbi:MAG: hypothetical protein U0893_20435 [Chloroflexota bacterium]